MGFFAWLLRRDEPVAEAPPQELDDAEVRESMRREEWVRVYAHVYAQGLTGKVMSAIHGDILPASVARHLQLLKEFAAQAADAAMELADERFPLTTLDEAPQVMTAELLSAKDADMPEGSAGAARVGDTVDAGYLTVITAPLGLGGAAVVQSVVWAPPGTSPPPVSVPPLTIVQEPSVALGRERIARATGGQATGVQAAQTGAAPAKAPGDDAKASATTDAQPAS